MDYKSAGVDIEAGYKSVELMKEHVKGTMRPEVMTNLGGFSGAFSARMKSQSTRVEPQDIVFFSQIVQDLVDTYLLLCYDVVNRP